MQHLSLSSRGAVRNDSWTSPQVGDSRIREFSKEFLLELDWYISRADIGCYRYIEWLEKCSNMPTRGRFFDGNTIWSEQNWACHKQVIHDF